MRTCGILMPIFSLPGGTGIGTLGREAYHFVDFLEKGGQSLWQILPLCPTGFGNSPYQSFSCAAGDPYFIDLDLLCEEGLLRPEEYRGIDFGRDPQLIDYDKLEQHRLPVLRRAFSRFVPDEAYAAFCDEQAYWLDDLALFMAAKAENGGRSFRAWPLPLQRRDPEALAQLRARRDEDVRFCCFLQYTFYRQWRQLKAYANAHGIKIVGDMPIYVADDSADVWAAPEQFALDETLTPRVVAGCPPDAFSADGQLWGMPVYDWDAMRREARPFSWWRRRVRHALSMYDVVRIDHFRGIDRYYEIPAFAETAVRGEWKQGPGEKLFAKVEGRGRVIAEDLGIMDEGVKALREKLGFPGMKVLLFAFDGNEDNEFLPKNIGKECVCYTGTHDNDTVAGYVSTLSTEEFLLFRSRVAKALDEEGVYIRLGDKGEGFSEAFCRLALASAARLAVLPVQDILGLDNEARMNYPGTNEGNWKFRMERLPGGRPMRRLKRWIKLYRR